MDQNNILQKNGLVHRSTYPTDGPSLNRSFYGICRSQVCPLNFLSLDVNDGPNWMTYEPSMGFYRSKMAVTWSDPTYLKDITIYTKSRHQFLLKFLQKPFLLFYLFPLSHTIILPSSISIKNQNPPNSPKPLFPNSLVSILFFDRWSMFRRVGYYSSSYLNHITTN